MEMSKAALPARYGYASKADEAHPRFAEYQRYRSSMSRLLVDSSSFRDWLSCTEGHEARDAEARHPRFREWQRAFIAGKMGRRGFLIDGKPPKNFSQWLENGGRF